MPEPVVRAVEVTRSFRTGGGPVVAVSHVSLAVERGEVLAIMGSSGSGKSTLLFLLAGLDRPDTGKVIVDGVDWRALRGARRARFRRRACGFVAQGMSLLPQATAIENVEIPLVLDSGRPVDTGRRPRAAELLDRVGLGGEHTKLPDQLSGGQQQRVAIARALVNEPVVVLADEPTANLDSENADAVARLLVAVAAERRAAVILVTHDPAVAAYAHRTVRLRSGRLDHAVPGSDRPDGRSSC